MKSRTVLILWFLAIALGIVASIVKFGNSDDQATRTKLAPGDKLIEALPIREVTKVTLTQGELTTTLVRTSDDSWAVAERDNYPINYELLRNLLGALEEIEVTQGYPSGSEHYGRFGLATKAEDESEVALQVTITGKDKSPVAEVYFGKYSGTSRSGGRFVRIGSDDSGVYAVGETFPGVTASPKDWINKDFLKIDQIKSIALNAPDDPAFKPWKLVRHPKTDGSENPSGQFELADMTDQEVMQLTSTNPLRNLFSYSAFQDVLNEKEAGETANPDVKLKRQAVITTYDGFTYTLVFWPQKEKPRDPDADDRLPAVQPSYLLTIDVTAEIAEKRTPEADESKEKPEVIKSRDSEFEKKKKALQEKLADAKAFDGRIYQVSQSTVSPLQKNRADFVKAKDKPTATTPPVRVPATPRQPLQPLPPRP
ncbi:MAG: DUF4340 domain-containing protein [Akkermansiaceae bacterium]|nr:DUF4340 domain-containing protein [Akkermansiaceae bacterium]